MRFSVSTSICSQRCQERDRFLSFFPVPIIEYGHVVCLMSALSMFQSNLPYAVWISDMVIFHSVLLIYTHIWLSSFWTELRCARNAKPAVMVILFQINAIKNCYSSYLSKSCRSEWLHLPWKNNFQTIGHPKMNTENWKLFTHCHVVSNLYAVFL